MKRVGLAVILAGACSQSLNEPPPMSSLAPKTAATGQSSSDLIREADAAWARRGQTGQAATAQQLYLQAAAADEHSAGALIGAMRALTYRIEHEVGAARSELAKLAVDLGQWCQRRAASDVECDYRLAIALGQQARERPSTGRDALGKMVTLLRRAIAAQPKLDHAGPHRVLALVLLRAPGWPIGPGDTDEGLVEARAAVALFPEAPDNQLALGEALKSTGANDAAREAYRKALALATAARDRGDPEGEAWMKQAHEGLGKVGGG
jgi:tetratricopeptide (TPR) repeat protein